MEDYQLKVLQAVISEREERELRRLWREAFQEEETYLDCYHRQNLRRNRIWTLWDGETLVAMLHANPYRIWQGSRIMPGCFLVGVATDARYRRQGCMRQLMDAALAALKAEGVPFVHLLPAREEYYRDFGFQTVGTQHAWVKKRGTEADPFLEETMWGRTERWMRMDDPDWMELVEVADFYNQWLKGRSAAFVWRDGDYFRRRWEESAALGGCLYRLQESGRITGAAALEQTEEQWRLYDVAGDELIAALERSRGWEPEAQPLKIMIKWLKKPEDPQEWLPFTAEELT